jgi:hypothetical protein
VPEERLELSRAQGPGDFETVQGEFIVSIDSSHLLEIKGDISHHVSIEMFGCVW